MRHETTLASVAALIGDPARAAMLGALAGGHALPAGELAHLAGLSAPAASGHLGKLVDGGLLVVEREGRHRYYRLAGPHIAAALESLAIIAGPPSRRMAASRTAEADRLRYARSCYDHLAGELGVRVLAALETRGFLTAGGDKRYIITPDGSRWFGRTFGIDVNTLKPGRHGIARRCLDWTERRYHLAGPLGAAMLHRMCELGWVERVQGQRTVQTTSLGREMLRKGLGVAVDC